MDRELKCAGNKLYGLVVDDDATGILEVRCTSRFCGKASDVVVLHRFNLSDGSYITRKYKQLTEGTSNGTSFVSTPLRTSRRQG